MTIWDHAERNVDRPGLRVGRYLTPAERFEEWLDTEDGITVYRETIRRALALRARGWDHFGIAAIFEAIRYDRAIALGAGAAFRLNNDYRSRLARKVMADVPELRGFFDVRELKA